MGTEVNCSPRGGVTAIQVEVKVKEVHGLVVCCGICKGDRVISPLDSRQSEP